MMSWFLREAGREHIVLERRDTLGGGWQDRWDGFRLVGPNWTTALPGFDYDDADPDGFMPRDAVVDRMRRYAQAIDAPVRLGVSVRRLGALHDGASRSGSKRTPERSTPVTWSSPRAAFTGRGSRRFQRRSPRGSRRCIPTRIGGRRTCRRVAS